MGTFYCVLRSSKRAAIRSAVATSIDHMYHGHKWYI